MVQMLAESVLIVVDPSGDDHSPVQVDALFALRNQGKATESMEVRFPMENPNGMGDGYGRRPKISGFKAGVDGQLAPITIADEPLEGGPPVTWAFFPVTFPPGEEVMISVSYSTLMFGASDGTEQAQIDYILETGAGWYGPIESAVITLRLPYAASSSNLFLSDPWNPQKVPPPVFVGREVRWEWTRIEPTSADNLSVVFIWPSQWKHILALEADTGERPANVESAIKLAEAYRAAGSERHGFSVSEPLYRLAKQAIQMALAYNPANPDLQAEMLTIEMWKCAYSYPPCAPEQIEKLLQTYDAFLAEHPEDARLTEWGVVINHLQQNLQPTESPTRAPTVQPTPIATDQPAAVPTATPLPPTPTATLQSTQQSDQATATNSDASPVPPFIFGLAAGAALVLGILALRATRRKG